MAVSSDGGHQSSGGDKSWARGQPEKVVDFLHRSAHVSAVHGKRIATEFYGRAPARAYFSGFSTGGHEGLMLAQRYPDDYDGILAGAANQDWTNLYLGMALSVHLALGPRPFRLPGPTGGSSFGGRCDLPRHGCGGRDRRARPVRCRSCASRVSPDRHRSSLDHFSAPVTVASMSATALRSSQEREAV